MLDTTATFSYNAQLLVTFQFFSTVTLTSVKQSKDYRKSFLWQNRSLFISDSNFVNFIRFRYNRRLCCWCWPSVKTSLRSALSKVNDNKFRWLFLSTISVNESNFVTWKEANWMRNLLPPRCVSRDHVRGIEYYTGRARPSTDTWS